MMDNSVLQSILSSTQDRRRPFNPLTDFPNSTVGANYVASSQGAGMSHDYPTELIANGNDYYGFMQDSQRQTPGPQVLGPQYPDIGQLLDYRGYFPDWVRESVPFGFPEGPYEPTGWK